jgi:hypothetical protein
MTTNATTRPDRSATARRMAAAAFFALALAAVLAGPAEAAQRNVMMEYFTNLY